jgi:hypothetical protein
MGPVYPDVEVEGAALAGAAYADCHWAIWAAMSGSSSYAVRTGPAAVGGANGFLICGAAP